MTFEFREAKRADVPLLILIAGGTGAGKTESALRLATGMAGGKPFAVIDTERGRALHKADDYSFQHAELAEPFTPERYTEAVKAADDAGFPVIVIDSGSHVYEGIGGMLEQQADEFKRMGERESARMSSWIAPKQRHKRFVQQLLRTRAHVILCLRAEDKIEIVKENGKTVVRPKQSLTGVQGWIPICEKRLPFEATISLLVTADAPGVPKPVKLERRHEALVPLDAPLSEETGQKLAAWAAGSSEGEPVPRQAVSEPSAALEAPSPSDLISDAQRRRLYTIATAGEVPDDVVKRLMRELAGVDSSKLLPRDRYDAVIEAVAAWSPDAAEAGVT